MNPKADGAVELSTDVDYPLPERRVCSCNDPTTDPQLERRRDLFSAVIIQSGEVQMRVRIEAQCGHDYCAETGAASLSLLATTSVN